MKVTKKMLDIMAIVDMKDSRFAMTIEDIMKIKSLSDGFLFDIFENSVRILGDFFEDDENGDEILIEYGIYIDESGHITSLVFQLHGGEEWCELNFYTMELEHFKEKE